jgi:hypothetical protein
LVYKLGRHPFTVEKAERYRYALPLKLNFITQKQEKF